MLPFWGWRSLLSVGQLSMGHAGFALIGGYMSALLAMKAGWSPIWGVLAAGAASAVLAAILGWIILRLRGVYFVLVSFSFGQILVLLALDISGITGGANGLIGIPPMSVFGLRAQQQAVVLSARARCLRDHGFVHVAALSVAVWRYACGDHRESASDGVEWRRHAPLPDDRIRDRQRYCRHRGRAEHALFPVYLARQLHFFGVRFLTSQCWWSVAVRACLGPLSASSC